MSTFALLVAAVAPALALAAPVDADLPKTEAPRFVLRADEAGAAPSLDALPLKETSAHIDVAGVIARVTIEQTWANEGKVPISAAYVFPAGARAAVVGMRMKIGERTIVADIAERKAARERYEEARDEGRTASLLEQQRPNVLSLDVANILPGDVIEVTVEYTELIVPTDGVYELVFPQVVGPRYGDGGSLTSGSSTRDGQPSLGARYRPKGSALPWRWSLDVRVSSGIPVQQIASPSHGLAPRAHRGDDVELAFEQGPRDAGGDRDFVLRWRLADDEIQTGVLLYRDREGESFFAALIEPPRRVAREDMPPRELVFVVDVSGSMHGFPLDTTRTLVRGLLAEMRPQDSFNILFFSGGSFLLSEASLPATGENLARADEVLASMSAGGGTELASAIDRALALPTDTRATSRSIVVVTDGYVGFEKQVFRTIRQNLGRANLFAFGVGSSVNRHLIDGMAKAGLAEPFVALNDDEARKEAKRFAALVSRPALTDVRVSFEGFDAYDVEPRAIPDLFEDRPLVVFGKYRGGATGRVRLRGLAGGERVERVVEVSDHLEKPAHRALRALWARQRVADLVDFSDATDDDVKEVTRLGLRYSLLTPYTSFVAVDDAVRNEEGGSVVVEQPLPLPAGVESGAVGYGRASFGSAGFGLMGSGAGGGGTGVGYGRGSAAPSGVGKKGKLSSRLQGAYGGPSGIDLGGRGRGTTTVRSGEAVARGALSQEHVGRVLRARLNHVRYCYEKALARTPALAGRVVVELEIGADGTVKEAKVKSSTLQAEEVDVCLVRVLSRLRFPRPADGNSVFVTYPFVFSPQ